MVIIKEKVDIDKLKTIENETFFGDMIKAVVDIEQGIIAVNAELHSDLEQMLLEDGSSQKNLKVQGDSNYLSSLNLRR